MTERPGIGERRLENFRLGTGHPPIRFDPFVRAKDPDLVAALHQFASHVQQRESELRLRQRRRSHEVQVRFRLAAEVIACNLLKARLLAPARDLAVPLGHDVLWGRGRYSLAVYGQHFIDACKVISHEAVGLADLRPGWRFGKELKRLSTLRGGERFFALFPPDLDWRAFDRDDEPELVVLKRPKRATDGDEPTEATRRVGGLQIDYRDTDRTRRWRRDVRWLNDKLRAAAVTVEAHPRDLQLDEQAQPIDPTGRSLKRVFNNGVWDNGGRLTGGFWMNMRRTDRFKYLRIDGEPVANVDFGQLYPRLVYVRADAPQPDGDLYDWPGDGDRSGRKKLLNALLFARGRLTHWPRDTSQCFPSGTKLADVIRAIETKHAPIAHLFGSGIGYELMFVESQMMMRILRGLLEDGMTALPLHDSVLVAKSKVEVAKEAMRAEFEAFTGYPSAIISVDFGAETGHS